MDLMNIMITRHSICHSRVKPFKTKRYNVWSIFLYGGIMNLKISLIHCCQAIMQLFKVWFSIQRLRTPLLVWIGILFSRNSARIDEMENGLLLGSLLHIYSSHCYLPQFQRDFANFICFDLHCPGQITKWQSDMGLAKPAQMFPLVAMLQLVQLRPKRDTHIQDDNMDGKILLGGECALISVVRSIQSWGSFLMKRSVFDLTRMCLFVFSFHDLCTQSSGVNWSCK